MDKIKEAEYEAIVMRYGRALYRYCYFHLSSDKELADETFNDVLLIFCQKWDSLERGDGIRAWLYRTADHCIRRSLSKKQRYYEKNRAMEDCPESETGVYFDHYFDSDQPLEAQLQTVEQALPEEFRPIFRYRFVQKHTINEIVELTGIPYSSLRLRLAKIEALVRAQVKKMFENHL